MQPWHYVVDSLLADLHPSILIWIVFGAFAGMATGLLPGLGAAAGMALLIPVTLTMDPVPALAMLTALYYGSMYGHTVTSIVLNAPADAAVASTFDGYPLTKQGRTGPALVIQAVVSGIGGTVGIILCSVIAIFAAKQTAHVGPAEVFLIVLVGLGCIVLMLGERRVYGLLCCIIGFAAGTVGTDVTTGAQRFTFGHVGLLGGIDFIPVVIGLFALAEIFYMLYQQHDDDSENAAETAKVKQGAFWPTRQDWRETRGATARSTLIGFGVGVLPGAGATAASLLAYSAEKAVSRTPEKFGKGAIEGLVAPEAAHTAAVAGAMVPMLTLGIPGSAATAVLLGAFLIFGLTPGPLFLTEHPDTAWGLISSMYIGNVVLVILSLAVIPFCVYLARIPLKTLGPVGDPVLRHRHVRHRPQRRRPRRPPRRRDLGLLHEDVRLPARRARDRPGARATGRDDAAPSPGHLRRIAIHLLHARPFSGDHPRRRADRPRGHRVPLLPRPPGQVLGSRTARKLLERNMTEPTITICAVGDIRADHVKGRRNDPDEVFALCRRAFSAADVNFFNCEGVYSDRVVTVPKQHTSGQANVADLAGVARAGFAVAGMANNHAMDLGAEGLFDTIDLARSLGMEVCGAGANLTEARRPAVVESRGIKVAFLSYNCVGPVEYGARAGRRGGRRDRRLDAVRGDRAPARYAMPGHDVRRAG